MAQGRTSPRAWDLLDEMSLSLSNAEVRTSAQQAVYAEALNRIDELADARYARLVEQASAYLPPCGVCWLSGG